MTHSSRPTLVATLVSALLLTLSSTLGPATLAAAVPTVENGTAADAPVTQPGPPSTGPGSTGYRWQDMRVAQRGSGADASYVFAPRGSDVPETLPLAVITHGYYEFEGYDQMYELIRHTVLSGNVVIYPRWQTGVASPCPGPVDIEPCLASATAGIKGGLRFLRTHPRWTQPRLRRTSYFGFSFGGVITADLANRWRSLDLPRPQAIFLDDPHDGGLVGPGEPALDDSLRGIPRTALVECHSGADGVIGEPGKAASSCNAVFPLLDHLPARNTSLVMTRTDVHGDPALSSAHGVCAGGRGEADAYDWNFCWKVWDALRASAYSGRWTDYALGASTRHTSMGAWSDGTPVAPLVVQDEAPLVP